jgi:hypothetical protein
MFLYNKASFYSIQFKNFRNKASEELMSISQYA